MDESFGNMESEKEGRMRPEIIFMPLGGGQRVGASCYYLKIGDSNILLDAGIGVDQGMEFEPNFHCLLTSPFMQSMGQINQIFISHAHMDHVGDLLKVMNQANYANVYMTEITKTLTQYQLYDRLFIGNREKDERTRLATKGLLEKITPVSFMKTLDFGKYRVTFYPAGHIPGAMMVLFEVGRKKILYTGDYSIHHTVLTQKCIPPKGMDIDTVILCGLHAKHPDYVKKSDRMFQQIGYVLHVVNDTGQSVLCKVPQLSKGIEFLKKLNDWNRTGIPIYIDESLMNVIHKMEQLSVPILNQYNRVMDMSKGRPKEAHIYLTSDRNTRWVGPYKLLNANFSLHEDFSEMKEFLKLLNPRQAMVVHCDKEKSVFDETIEQEMMRDGECRTQFTFAEENEIYQL